MMKPSNLLLGLALFWACLCPALGRITDASVVRDERPIILIATPFGFGSDGNIDITVKNFVYWHQGSIDLSQLGFFVTTSEAEGQLEVALSEGTCALNAEHIVKLLTFDAVDKNKAPGSGVTEVSARLADLVKDYAGGEYSLFYANCAKATVVSFDIRTALYNVRGAGVRDYLSVGEDMLPVVYMVMFVLFAVVAALWGAVLIRQRAHAHRLHGLMAVLVAFKALTLLSQAGMFQLIRTTGHPEGWNVAFYVFNFLRGILFFTVVVLIGTGWSYMTPFLRDREKRILMIVIPLQVCAEVAIVVLDENTPASRAWFTWRDILHLVDIVCCCAILFPIVWSIKHLREAAGTDGKAARNLLKLQLFRQFYVMVVAYIYITRILVYLLRSTMPYRYVWLSDASGELATLAFYVATAVAFQPTAENPYLHLADDDIDLQELREATL